MNLFSRRGFCKTAYTAAALHWFFPLLAKAGWSLEYFQQSQLPTILTSLSNGKTISPSDQIQIDAPDSIGDGSSVRVEITSQLPGVSRISLLVKDNPLPLCCYAFLSSFGTPYLATSIKMSQSSVLIALLETDQGFFSQEKSVTVTLGGCD